jgi:hypothetical protein
MQINIARYPETCSLCSWPARTELTIDERFGHDWFEFCVNPKCMHFDGAALRQQRENLERVVRASKTFRRYRARLWRSEIHKMGVARRQLRESIKRFAAI